MDATPLQWTPPQTSVEVFGDAIQYVFKALEDEAPPPALLWLKGLSSGWRDNIRKILCGASWENIHRLPDNWAEGARALLECPHVPHSFHELLSLTKLSLKNVPINALEARGIAAIGLFSASLTRLSLCGCNLEPVRGIYIAFGISCSRSLTDINLSGRMLTSDGEHILVHGVEAISTAIGLSTSLTSIDLASNDLG